MRAHRKTRACCGLLALVMMILSVPVVASGSSNEPVDDIEVGAVEWQRDLDAAIEASRRSGKPVLAFFQEVPGCSGCRSFGATVMSYGPIVQAIEGEFLPVLIYNNRGGKDAEILDRYDEPAWNYQVIRFLDGNGRDLIPRRDRVWTRDALAERMVRALEAAGRKVPGYLAVAAYEDDAGAQKKVAFAQSCFWNGEVQLGQIPGVVTTEAGWFDGHEVTLVRYRPDLVSLNALVDQAVAAGVADAVYLTTREQQHDIGGIPGLKVGLLDGSYRRAPSSDQKRQIRNSVFAEVDLSAMQQTKVNAFVAFDTQKATSWLTPAQLAELERLQARR